LDQLSVVGRGDIGLLFYGLVEVSAAIANEQFASTEDLNAALSLNPLANAVLVQAIILASWVYSSLDPSSSDSNQL
jgi:hypothetical protein